MRVQNEDVVDSDGKHEERYDLHDDECSLESNRGEETDGRDNRGNHKRDAKQSKDNLRPNEQPSTLLDIVLQIFGGKSGLLNSSSLHRSHGYNLRKYGAPFPPFGTGSEAQITRITLPDDHLLQDTVPNTNT